MKKLLLTLWFLSSYSLYSLSFDDQLKKIIGTDDSRLSKVEESIKKKCDRTFPN